MIRRKDVLMEDDRYSGKTVSVAMPHTKEKQFKCNATNNNDHNYLHKKFKKMASTVSAPTQSLKNESNVSFKELDVAHSATHSSISNGSIAAAHPEIEKVKKSWLENLRPGKDVQINFSNDNHKLNELHVNITGQTSASDEFSLKTDNNDNDFAKDVQSSGSSGRYICPYCKLSCAKPSVLQKHIRAHTNERPYPCIPCGFAFKTKSNLYKHRRSRTHALRLQGNDMISSPPEDDWSAGSESDNSLPPTSTSDHYDGMSVSMESNRPSEFSSPELNNDCPTPLYITEQTTNDNNKLKSIYKPKFRAAFYLDQDDRQKKPFSPNADFLNEHISKIISDNEAIVDVIETPLQKKYGKIKQIAESKQLNANIDNKTEFIALNLTKNCDSDNGFRKRSHSESFPINNQKHPLNPEGSIIKDLLLKTKASNGLTSITAEMLDGISPPYICPLCQIPYRSADNLEVHRTYYCKGLNNIQNVHSAKESKSFKYDNASFMRSNSINVKFPEMVPLANLNTATSPPLRTNKPENLVIIKPETAEVVAPLPSPGPLLGNTRLVDSRVSSDHSRNTESFKALAAQSPKRKIERNDNFSPRHMDNVSPRSVDMYLQSKIRCLEHNSTTLSQFDEYSNNRPNSNSLQMFGGEVKILDYSGGTTTLRIEPSKNHLSPILIQSNLSPSKIGTETEASSVVVRSGLHSGGTMVHNIPTPKETISTPKSQSSRLHNTHFQFPPLSAITAFNPLTLPLRPSLSPNGTSSILHGGKIIPHVPGMPGPNTSDLYVGNSNLIHQKSSQNIPTTNTEVNKEVILSSAQTKAAIISKLDGHIMRNDIIRGKYNFEFEKSKLNYTNTTIIPVIKVDETGNSTNKPNLSKVSYGRLESNIKRAVDAPLKIMTKDCHDKHVDKMNANIVAKNIDNKTSNDLRQFNFENLITKAEIYNNQLSNSEINKNVLRDSTEKNNRNERSDTLYFQKNCTSKGGLDDKKGKFLRPSTLPLKPGTFTPKRHHGITPNANTMPLVSPETPRPSKAYGQLYLNGNAYTYLGLKCSTKVFYCTINRPQPTYVPNQHFLSMYSNWQLLSELTPDPLGLSASSAMSLYDSRHRPQNTTIATLKHDLILTHSSQWKENKQETTDVKNYDDDKNLTDNNVVPKKELTGGFESNEEYTYVRGRGRGRYVCSECGIRCKKPSMLKKHIRTHTDVRPYTCTHCAFSFKTKGNLTKHMKSKAHYKKCCELGINPNEGNEMEVGENTQGSGETDEETDSDGDEGNEGETESSDTETCKSRLPEHEAAHCLLSLGGTRLSSATPCFLTSARPSTYPYTPTGVDIIPTEQLSDKRIVYNINDDNKMDIDNEPMDLSRSDGKSTAHVTEIPTAHESIVLASLASNTAKLPHNQNQWANGEPMLHAYLTERALLDSKIKQSQLTSNLSKLRQTEADDPLFKDKNNLTESANKRITTNTENNTLTSTTVKELATTRITQLKPIIKKETTKTVNIAATGNTETESKIVRLQQNDITHNTENAKFVVSEYLKHAKVNALSENHQFHKDNFIDIPLNTIEDPGKLDESSNSDNDSKKIHAINHDLVAQKVVIGAGGVAFKVSKGKEFDPSPSYTPGKLMEDGRRVCDFCNKTFTKPSQLKIHLNIHYMERPFKCSACAVSFRTRGHLQKHERSGSHHNKVSMTSTFGAATSLNPRPFRCSDCNIAFRIHGHLAKHLRSKMHVMKLECLFKLPFGTFTEIERAGVSLTDIDTTDCASSLSSLQVLAHKLHEKDPTKLEYRDPSTIGGLPSGKESSEDEDGVCDRVSESDKDSDVRTTSENITNDSTINYSATDS